MTETAVCTCADEGGGGAKHELSCPSFPLGGYCACGKPYGSLHSCAERIPSPTFAPAAQALETLALMAEHRMHLMPEADGRTWTAIVGQPRPISRCGSTIGDAVRAVVARIRGDRG